jgi:UDP-N-acetylmuramoylalanine-D-glutamate ligase
MRVLVCGGRDYDDKTLMFKVLDSLPKITLLIAGDAKGADQMAHYWAAMREVTSKKYAAEWRVYGPAAGPIRNQVMLERGKPELVVAFPGGRGTADMVSRAKKAGVKVMFIDRNGNSSE